MASPSTALRADDPATLDLPDGRTLAYAEYGDPDGEPVFCFHGVPGARLMWSLFDDVARRIRVRVIAPERPGFGHSDFQPGREVLDWPDDVTALADRLGVDAFGVVGFSGGGPHAAACAAALPERVERAVLVSSVAPPSCHEFGDAYEKGLVRASRYVPGFSRAAFASASWLADHWRSRFEASLVGSAAPPDRDLFDEPAGEVLLDDAVEAFRSGGRGAAHEFPLLDGDWGFGPDDVEAPAALYHGRQDETVAPESAEAFAERLPDASLHLVDRAHYTTLVRERESILRDAAGEEDGEA